MTYKVRFIKGKSTCICKKIAHPIVPSLVYWTLLPEQGESLQLQKLINDTYIPNMSIPDAYIPDTYIHTFTHSFIPAISIAPLQVLYHSEALLTTARILYRSFTPKRTGNCR